MKLGLLTPLFAIAAPFLVWPIEYYLPYPFVVEEIVKGLLVLLILKDHFSKSKSITLAVIAGALFAFSESVFYLINIFSTGNGNALFLRILLTTPLHIITTLIIMLFGLKKRSYIVFGVIVSGIVHYIFNLLVA